MVNYKNGKIYKLVSFQAEKCYIGSTCQLLYTRLAHHRSNYNQYINNNYHFVTSFLLLELEDVQIILIENYPCNNKEELHARERYWIENLECVNKHIPTRTDKEYRQDNKETIKEKAKKYREDNKETIKEKVKKYREDNKEMIREKKKNYREDNKEKISQDNKEYYKDNKDKLLEYQKQYRNENNKEIKERKRKTIQCECGLIVNKNHLARHYGTKRHTDELGLPPVLKNEENHEKEKSKKKQYREKNKEKIKDKKKETIQCECGLTVNKNHLARHQRSKQHTDALGLPPVLKNEENHEKEKSKKKQYYEENKEKLNEKKKETIQCECGLTVNKNHLVRHCRSQQHINALL